MYSTEVMHEIRETCLLMSVPLDGLLKELDPGQYELNLHHVDNPLQAADNAQLLKQGLENGPYSKR